MILSYKLTRRNFCCCIVSIVVFLFTSGTSLAGNLINSKNVSIPTENRDYSLSQRIILADFLEKKEEEKTINPLRKLTISGFYRAYVYTRTMEDAYTKALEPLRVLSVGDGYREPLLNFDIGAKPTKDTYFNYQMFFMPNYAGPSFDNRLLSLQFGITLSGGIKTKFGKYDITLGGSNWQKLSQFTLWQNEGLNRFSTFDRRPWDASGLATSRYKEFNDMGTINQDVRWGKRPFQGVYIESTGMPKKLGLVFMYGKTDNNGGGTSYLNPNFPDQLIAGKLSKNYGRNSIAYNTFNRMASRDAVKDVFVGYDIHTLQYVYIYRNIKFSGEVGAGSYTSPTHPQKYSEGVNLGFFIPKKFTYLPLNVQLFQIGPNFINLNTIVLNTSLAEAQNQSSSLANSQSIFPFNSPITEIGQLTNNRKGVNINTEKIILKKIRVNMGYGNAKEIERINSAISYSHRVNGLAISRLNPFVAGVGPYNRLGTLFRGYFETANLSDTTSAGKPLNDKYYNTLEVQVKYGNKFFKKDFFLFYNGYFNSVQPMFSLFNKFNDDAYIRAYSNEFDLHYNIVPKFTLVGYYGIERIIGNRFTDLNTSANPTAISYTPKAEVLTNNPRNQIGQGIGIGFDVDLGKDVGLYYRHRWFQYEDKNFAADRYKGQEATIELKVTF